MLKEISAAAAAKTIRSFRVGSITITVGTIDEAELPVVCAVLWGLCVAPSDEQRAHHPHSGCGGPSIPAALTNIVVWFPWHKHGNTSILKPLVADHPALVRSLRVLKTAHNGYDESVTLGAFAALATQLRELTFAYCGLTSLQGLEGHCEYLRKVELSGCQHLTSIDALADRVYLEEVNAYGTAITSIELLRTCPVLTEVVAGGCRHLSSIEALAGHRRLQLVDAANTGITSIEPLRSCPNLTQVDILAVKCSPLMFVCPPTSRSFGVGRMYFTNLHI